MHINFQILKISYFSQRLVYRSSQVYRPAQARNTATRPKFSESKEFLCIVMTCDSKWAKWAPSLYLSSLSLSLSFSLTHQHTQFIDFIPTISPALRHAWEITERFFFCNEDGDYNGNFTVKLHGGEPDKTSPLYNVFILIFFHAHCLNNCRIKCNVYNWPETCSNYIEHTLWCIHVYVYMNVCGRW